VMMRCQVFLMKRKLIMMLTWLIGVVALQPVCGGADDARAWQSHAFDGMAFHEGIAESEPSVYTKEGYLPFSKMKDDPLREDKLPAGTGGLVVICYIQSAGGKLQKQSGYAPFAGAAIEIRNGGRIIVVRSDRDGYAFLALPAGKYDIQVRGFTQRALVEKGKTIFVAIRAGKRLVD